jgi:hypothetical protein
VSDDPIPDFISPKLGFLEDETLGDLVVALAI